jgi:hypothetical protein
MTDSAPYVPGRGFSHSQESYRIGSYCDWGAVHAVLPTTEVTVERADGVEPL